MKEKWRQWIEEVAPSSNIPGEPPLGLFRKYEHSFPTIKYVHIRLRGQEPLRPSIEAFTMLIEKHNYILQKPPSSSTI